MSAATPEEDVVRSFCEAFARRDVDELLGFFADDAVYHNIPTAPAVGTDAIRATLELFVPSSPSIEFELLHLASNGPVVFTERIDRMTFAGNPVELPVAGVFEVADGKITAWRDYFDMQMFLGGGAAAG
jgi:limonene-1,2-epoxide hydrolase